MAENGEHRDLRERIQAAASSALSPWADPENDDWRDAAADQVADAVLVELADEMTLARTCDLDTLTENERLRTFIRRLDISTMHPDMGGHHQCRVRANAQRLTPEEWAIVRSCEAADVGRRPSDG